MKLGKEIPMFWVSRPILNEAVAMVSSVCLTVFVTVNPRILVYSRF